MPKPDYDTTVARIAGNIASGMLPRTLFETGGRIENVDEMAAVFVMFARAIVEEVKRTTPKPLAGLTVNGGNIQQSDTPSQAGDSRGTEG